MIYGTPHITSNQTHGARNQINHTGDFGSYWSFSVLLTWSVDDLIVVDPPLSDRPCLLPRSVNTLVVHQRMGTSPSWYTSNTEKWKMGVWKEDTEGRREKKKTPKRKTRHVRNFGRCIAAVVAEVEAKNKQWQWRKLSPDGGSPFLLYELLTQSCQLENQRAQFMKGMH